MHRLLEIGASNAATVAVLALLVCCFSRLYRRPALIHGLWVLLLVKLLTPPLIDLPLPKGWMSETSPERVSPPAATVPASSSVSLKTEAANTPELRTDFPAVVPSGLGEVHEEPAPAAAALGGEAASSAALLASVQTKQRAPSTLSERRTASASGAAQGPSQFAWILPRVLFCVWWLGSCVILTIIAARVRRFKRLLRHALPASPELEREAARLAAHLHLRKAPPVRMLPGVISPMLWGFPRPTILFPAKLAEQLDAPSRETLLLHELAHYRRWDHWTRVLEMLVTIAYWWHPCLWWIRREMRTAEEDCCDGWVISHSPEFRPIYARALIAVLDFLADRRPALPPASSGIGNLQSATKRLTAIMVETPRQELGRWGLLALAAAAVPCLCLAPTFATGDSPDSNSQRAAKKTQPSPKPRDNKNLRFPETVESGKFEAEPISLDGQREKIRALAYSADGKRLVASYGNANSPGSLNVWDVSRKRPIAIIPQKNGLCGVHISPDGKRIAGCGLRDQMIRVYDVETGNVLTQIPTENGHTRVRFSPDGNLLATASMDGLLQLWDLGQIIEGKQPMLAPAKELAKLDFNLQSVAFFPDGKHVAAGGGPWEDKKFGFAGVWNIATGERVAKMEGMPDAVLGIAVSRDGKQVATAGHDGATRLWNAETGKSIKVLTRSNWPLEWVDYSPDGKLLATGSYDDKATVWNVETGQRVALLEEAQGDVMSVRFSPDGKTLATGGQDAIIRLWDASNWKVRDRLEMGLGPDQEPNIVTAVASSPNGRLIATAQGDRTVLIRDLATTSVVRQISGHNDLVSSVAFSADGTTLATGSYDHDVKTWDVATGKETHTFKGHSNWVMSVAFSPDGKTLASAGYDKTVRLWNVAKGNLLRELKGHTASVRAVAFSGDGTLLATGSSDHTAKIWDAKTGEEKFTLKGHTSAIRAVAFQPKANRLATASEDATVRLWDLETGNVRSVLGGHEKMIWSLAFSPTGQTLATGGMQGEIFIWDSESGTRRQILRRHSDIVSGLAFVPNSNSLVSVSYDKTTKQWAPVAAPLKEIAHRMTGGPGASASFAGFTSDGQFLVATDKFSGLCRVWSVETGDRVREFQAQNGHIRAGALSPDGKYLAASQPKKSIRICEIPSGRLFKEIPTDDYVRALAFSPDGKLLAAVGDDKKARLWNIESGAVKSETPEQSDQLQAVAFSPDGTQFVTSSGDWVQSNEGEVVLWETASGSQVAVLGRHQGRINAVQFTPDGRQVLAATNEAGQVLFFDVKERKEFVLRLGTPETVLSMTLSPDGTRIALGKSTGRVSLWDLASRRKILEYAGHTPGSKNKVALVWSLAFSPDGRLLASAAYDEQGQTVRLWPTSKTEPIPVNWK